MALPAGSPVSVSVPNGQCTGDPARGWDAREFSPGSHTSAGSCAVFP